MIARISGTIVYKYVQAITLDAHGIGYRVFVPLTTFYELPETGQAITLHIHTHVKEDAINLFGFQSPKRHGHFNKALCMVYFISSLERYNAEIHGG